MPSATHNKNRKANKSCFSVHLGHASSGSRPAAEQVKIGSYYDGGWYAVLRPKTLELAAKSALICEAGCNNNNILYSQLKRNTLKSTALAAAGLNNDNKGSNLSKITPDIISKISTTCYADCSSFMTFCACCAGAKFGYDYWGGGNAPTCSKMVAKFTNNGAADADYVVLRDTKYLNNSDYLQRGDILLSDGHTVMVLDCGSKAPEFDYSSIVFGSGMQNTAYVSINTLKITPTISQITTTKVRFLLNISKIEDGVEKVLDRPEELALYTWTYELKLLEDLKKKSNPQKLKVGAAKTVFSFSSLLPNKTYILNIAATKTSENIKLKAASIIFTTLPSYPTAVRNLSINYNDTETLNKKCTINFSSPLNWGDPTLQKCYRVFLIVNGECVSYNDSLISTSTICRNKSIHLSQLVLGKLPFTYNDVIQIGILPGLKDYRNKFIYDSNALSCSSPFVVENSMKIPNKVYVKLKNNFEQTQLFNRKVI